MENKEIARRFNKLGKIMELHKENPFKIRSYSNAYNTLRKIETPLADMDHSELSSIQGVGKAIADKIIELCETGELITYNNYAEKTPEGIIEMLGIRGFGPKKIFVIWKDLGIETIGELLYACNENRLVELKGFGIKTQNQLKGQLQYFIDSQGKYLYGYIIDEATSLLERIRKLFSKEKHDLIGEIKRLLPIVHAIEIITTVQEEEITSHAEQLGISTEEGNWKVKDYPIKFIFSTEKEFGALSFELNSPDSFFDKIELKQGDSELDIFIKNTIPFIPAECRELIDLSSVTENYLNSIITKEDIKGVVHCHSTYSDGIHSLKEMAEAAENFGYGYLVITDHSKAAFYANGLKEDEVLRQFEEINSLNASNPNFKIFKGIEADILNDGSMDYGNEFLDNFEVVIASVHSNLKMDIIKATSRIIKAIENPHVHILGHPTGRLLLSRSGYPIDHMKIIEACASNNVVIELNANPLRLDLDWSWIPVALEKGVKISINPDSHNKESIKYIDYGVNVARKSLLPKEECLNAKNLESFTKWVHSLK